MSKFTKTTLKIEILSENPIPEPVDVEEVLRQADYGDYVFAGLETEKEELTSKQTADALYEAGSEPSFFMLDDAGNKTDE